MSAHRVVLVMWVGVGKGGGGLRDKTNQYTTGRLMSQCAHILLTSGTAVAHVTQDQVVASFWRKFCRIADIVFMTP